MNSLTEHGIGSYEELVERCNAVSSFFIRTKESLQDTERLIDNLPPLDKANRRLP